MEDVDRSTKESAKAGVEEAKPGVNESDVKAARPEQYGQEIDYSNGQRIISFVGAGGKTLFMYALARREARRGKKVVITTTTHLRRPEWMPMAITQKKGHLVNFTNGWTVVSYSENLLVYAHQGVIVLGRPDANEMLASPFVAKPVKTLFNHDYPNMGSVHKLLKECEDAREYLDSADLILIEADGAKTMPFCYPREKKPVLLRESDTVYAVAGMRCVGKTFREAAFGYGESPMSAEQVHDALKAEEGRKVIDARNIVDVLCGEHGLRSDLGKRAYTIILNQCDCEEHIKHAEKVIANMQEQYRQLEAEVKVFLAGHGKFIAHG